MSTPVELLLKAFAQEVEEEIIARLKEAGEEASRDNALAEQVLERLEEEGVSAAATFCQHADDSGRRRCAITAFALDESGDHLQLFLAAAVDWSAEPGTMPSSEIATLAGKAARFFDYSAQKTWERFKPKSEALEAARTIHSAMASLTQVTIFIITNAIVRDRQVEDLVVAGLPVRFEVIDLERLFRISHAATSRQDIEIDFTALCGRPLACLEMVPRASEYETYLAIFPAPLLYDLYERYGHRLFEFNVRSFLQAKGKVNKGLRDTLEHDPERFMAYNNGIVATADSMDVGMFHGESTISKIVGLQIVNGAQTTASIHRAKKVDRVDLSKVSVAVKITKVAPDKLQEFVPKISLYANTQNAIQAADLTANNEFHIELERISQVTWCPGEENRWFYERARGAYQDALQREGSTPAKRRDFKLRTPSSQRITKTELAKYVVAWLGRPHVVSMGAQKNFTLFMADLPTLFPSEWKPDEAFFKRVVAQAILFRTCERLVRARKFPAYRANISAYLFALLAHVTKGETDFQKIWQQQRASDPLVSLLDRWAPLVDTAIRESAGARNVTEWCKKQDCWEAVRAVIVGGASAPEITVPAHQTSARDTDVSASPSTEDQDAINECMRHDAATWAKLNYWGVSTSVLDYYERGVAHTLSEYAASGWSRTPSIKQARIGIRVVHRARDANML